jgi:hypothetical protein
MQYSEPGLARKTLCVDRELKGTNGDTRKEEVPVPIGHQILVGLSFPCKPHSGGENEVSVLVDDRATDIAHGLLGVLGGRVLPRQDSHSRFIG